MVREVVKKHPPRTRIKDPSIVQLFLDFGELFSDCRKSGNYSWKQSRLRAFFTMHNPIFLNSDKHLLLTNKILDVYQTNRCDQQSMEKYMLFEDRKTYMGQWNKKLHTSTYCIDTYRFSPKRREIYHQTPIGILNFYRDCYDHSETEVGMTESRVERELNNSLPYFLPKMYYEFVGKVVLENRGTANHFMNLFHERHPRFP